MVRWIVIVCCLVSFVSSVGCGRRGEPKGKPARPDKKLKIKVEMSVEPTVLTRSMGDRAKIRIFVSNMEDKPKAIEFETSHHYTIYAYDEGGRQYNLTQRGESPELSKMRFDPRETKVFDEPFKGHFWNGRDVIHLPAGRYEIEVRIKAALSNTVFIWIEE